MFYNLAALAGAQDHERINVEIAGPIACRWLTLAVITLSLLPTGCNSNPVSTNATPQPTTKATQQPPRPNTPPPSFKLFHQTNDSFTLLTIPTATDTQIAALIYQLRHAAHTRTFDALHIPQKLVDARDPMVWFHIYRGPKCADEKYTNGKLPCGPSYHAAGDYTFGGGTNHQWDDGVLLHGEKTKPSSGTLALFTARKTNPCSLIPDPCSLIPASPRHSCSTPS